MERFGEVEIIDDMSSLGLSFVKKTELNFGATPKVLVMSKNCNARRYRGE